MILGVCFSKESLAVIDKHKLVTSGRSGEELKWLVACHFPGHGVQKGSIMDRTRARQKASVFADLPEIKKQQFENIDDFNVAYDTVSKDNDAVKARPNLTGTERDSNLYTAYNEFCGEEWKPEATTRKRKHSVSSYQPIAIDDPERKRAPKNASEQEMQEWEQQQQERERTAKRQCIKCEAHHLRSEWDVMHSSAWARIRDRTCATCRGTPAPKKLTACVELCVCVEANRQCGGSDDDE